MTAPLEILLSEHASGTERIVSLVLSPDDSNRLSLPTTIQAVVASSAERARAILERKEMLCHVIIIEMEVPDASSLRPVSSLTKDFPSIPVIILTNQSSQELVNEAIRLGAQNYLVKTLQHEDSIARAILGAIDRQRVKRKIEKLVIKLRSDEVLT
jgi:DNA-binding NarL/FixJ family response regulator